MKRILLILLFFSGNLCAAEKKSSISQDRFEAATQAMKDGDWESAVRIQESMIGDGLVSAPLLKNLAIARGKQHNLGQSLAAWLGARALDSHDPVIDEGIRSTLAALQLGPDSLDLSAHGPFTAWFSERSYHDVFVFIYLAMTMLIVSIAAIAVWLLTPESRSSLRRIGKSLTIPAFLITLILWACTLVIYARVGGWGAVINSNGTAMRSGAAEGATELTHLKPGTPIFVTGETYQRWLDVRTSDGLHGYVDGLEVRVIRTF